MSNSVADALEFVMSDMKHPDFVNASATIKFIRLIDHLFDVLNSRNAFGRGYKSPIKKEYEGFWQPFFTEAIDYLSSLKDKDGNLLWYTRKKTASRCFVTDIISIMGIYNDFMKREDTPLQYLLTYKLSQDHLELGFCNVW